MIAIPRSVMMVGGAVLGGAVLGGGIGAVQSLKSPATDGGFSTQEGRDTLANAIIGAGIGAASGVGLLYGGRALAKVMPSLGGLLPQSMPLALGAGAAIGGAGLGAYTLARHALD